MVQRIPCPNCKQAIFFLDSEGSESICSSCSYRYILSQGILEYVSSRVEADDTNRQLTRFKDRRLVYDLRVSTSEEYRALQFRLLNSRMSLRAVPGDRLIMLHLRSGKSPRTLAWLKNATTGVEHRLQVRDKEVRSISRKVGCLVFLSGLIISMGLSGMPARVLQVSSLPLAIGAGCFAQRKRRMHLQDGTYAKSLCTEQSLLRQLDELEQKCKDRQAVHQSTRNLVQRLGQHRAKILALDEQAYLNQANTIDRGIKVLEKQLDLSRYLVKQYRQAISLLEVEIEAGRIVEQLPDEVAINQKLWCELNEINETEHQLYALKQELSLSGIDSANRLLS